MNSNRDRCDFYNGSYVYGIMIQTPVKYSVLKLNVSGFNRDILSSLFFRQGCLGIEEESENSWQIYFSGRVSAKKRKHFLQILGNLNPSFDDSDMKLSQEKEKDWLKEWKKSFYPFKLAGNIWISPPWEMPKLHKGEIQIIIDPRMAFGTGHHATTQLMIEAMQGIVKKGDTVLDAGCGSGILSILARKMGAGRVCGFDPDPDAVENSRHNARLNHCDNIDFRMGTLGVIPEYPYDIILANINRTVLCSLLPALSRHLKTGGTIFLSGLLQEELEEFVSALPGWLLLKQKLYKKEWVALVLKK